MMDKVIRGPGVSVDASNQLTSVTEQTIGSHLRMKPFRYTPNTSFLEDVVLTILTVDDNVKPLLDGSLYDDYRKTVVFRKDAYLCVYACVFRDKKDPTWNGEYS